MSWGRLLWPTWVLLAVVGAGCAALDVVPVGPALLALAGAAALLTIPLRRQRARRELVVVSLGAGAALGILLVPVAGEVRVAMGAALAQAVLGYAARARGTSALTRALAWTSHAAVATGSLALVVPGGSGVQAALFAYAGGFGVLLMHAQWARGPSGAADDLALLGAIALGIIATTWWYVAGTGLFGWMMATRGASMLLAILCALAALLALARPAGRPRPDAAPSPALSALAHGAAALGVMNVLFVAVSLVSLWSARVLIAAMTAFIALAVAMEYTAIRRARAARALFREPPPSPDMPDITLLVAARDDARALEASLDQNLLLPCRVLLAVSASSRDDTIRVASEAAKAHPDRVRVLVTTGSSKAQDLNMAWTEIDTDLVLMLDADETIDEKALRWAVAALARDPSIAVVQGRKVSRAPDVHALARFVSTERRHATGLDQTLHSDLGSTHFAGSAALLRKAVVTEIGGWTDQTLTEDIEFTLRLHLGSSWRIVYEPRMLVHESDPCDLRALVAQRTRWSRGWAQCFALYFREVLAARGRLGKRRAFGLAWLLIMAVSAPLMALLPALVLMRAVGIPSLLPYALGVAVAAFILPARLIAYGYSALHDPHIPVARRPLRFAETLVHAYAWILVGWILSLHALYLEVSAAPRAWDVTRKSSAIASRTRAPTAHRGVRA